MTTDAHTLYWQSENLQRGCRNKVHFETYAKAMKALRGLNGRQRHGGRLNVYECPICSTQETKRWCIGHANGKRCE